MRRMSLMGLWAVMGLAIAGCGGGGGTGGAPSQLVGTWELRQQSDDGGETFDNVNSNNRFQFTYNTDFTWSDSAGDSGTWSTNGGRLTVTQSNNEPTEFYLWRLESNADVLRITGSDFQGTATQRVSLYVRVN